MFDWLKRLLTGAHTKGQTGAPIVASDGQPMRVLQPADAQAYGAILDVALQAASPQARMKVEGALNVLPIKATGLDVGVHPSQEGDGTFSVVMHAAGPDSFVLNKAIAPHRTLFEAKAVPRHPDLPLFDPQDVEYDVNDTIAAAVERWIAALWVDMPPVTVPVTVVLADDFLSRPAFLVQGSAGKSTRR